MSAPPEGTADTWGPDEVSVVIPAHNAETTLARAVTSARGQTRPPGEIVVVDDGSTDATAAIAEGLGPAVHLVRQPQAGPSAARNAGVAAARGRWIAFLDADDEWHPEKLARQLDALTSATALVATDWSRHTLPAAAPAAVPRSRVTSHDLLLMNRFQTSTVLLRREAFTAAGGFDTTLDGVEDWDMWLRASAHGEVLKLDWPFVRYVSTPESYSKKVERVYSTGRTMLDRRLGPEPDRRGRSILAWHHLRWAVAFVLGGDRASARRCLRDLRRSGLTSAAPDAALRYLAPFLAGRARRRARVLLDGRPGAAAVPAAGAASFR